MFMVATLAHAQVCAPPSLLLNAIPPGGIVNDFYAGSGSPTLNPGTSTLTLGARDPRGYTTTLVIGDLLMVMQMQDGTINTSNSSLYGSGTGSGNGSTTLRSAGLYEFVRITAITGTGGITFTPALTNQYFHQNGTTKRRYQVVRVLQFSTVTAAGVTTPAWNGNTGGVVAMDVRDTLTLGNATVEGVANRAIFAAGKGFRGGRGRELDGTTTANTQFDYVLAATTAFNASKGEGFIGTPFYVAVKTNGWGQLTTTIPTALNTVASTEGYPGAGSYGKGGPGNAGGGGNDADTANANTRNAGGGGGGNYGAGGIGGRPWSRPLIDSGGLPGAGYAGSLAFNRVFLGGGGGAGSTNDATADNNVYNTVAYPNLAMACTLTVGQCSSGAAGGGVVVIRARSVTGAGVVDVRGAHGYNVANDSGGGGGAGGSVVVETLLGGGINVDASGGHGGNAWAGQAAWSADRHGPGGAGGGGFVAYAPATMAVSASYDGGLAGQTMNNSLAMGGPLVENYGSSSADGGLATFQTPNIPGVVQAARCNPSLGLLKTDFVTSLTSPGTTTYSLTITNSGASDSSGTITIADTLPVGLSVVPGPLTLTGPHAASWGCSASTTTAILCTSTASIVAGTTRSFAIAVAVSAANGSSLVNKALISGGGDPAKTTTATPLTAATCTANAAPLAGCAVDTDTVVAPNLALSKTNDATQFARGASFTYVLTVSNTGGTPTSSTITVADWLSAGLTYVGAASFTSGDFNCAASGQGIVCDSATPLASSASTTITFTVQIDNSSPAGVLNVAQVGGGGDPSPAKSTRPATTSASLCAAPTPPATNTSDDNNGCATDQDQVLYVSLDLTKDDAQFFVSVGGFTDYVFTVRNIGTIASSGTLTVVDALPNGSSTGTMSFAISPGPFIPAGANGADWSCTAAGTTTVCVSAVPIAAGGSSSFVIRTNVAPGTTAGAQFLNRSRVGGGGDVSPGMISVPSGTQTRACFSNGSPAGCAIDLDTAQLSPEIRLSKSHPNPQGKSVGDSFTFSLVISNSGGANSAANTVRMIDVVPAGLTINGVIAAPPFTCATALQVVTCNNTLAQMTATSSITIRITVTVAAGATNPTLNRARVGTNNTDPQNNAYPTTATVAVCSATDVPALGCAADPVPLIADLQVEKLQLVGTTGTFASPQVGVLVGGTVSFQINIRNTAGSATAQTVTFSDTIPNVFSTLTVVSSTNSPSPTSVGCAGSLAGNLFSGFVTTMPAGSSCSVVIRAIANANTTGVTNTAIVSIPVGIGDSNATNNTSAVNTVIGYTNLGLTKTNGVTALTSGTTTSYTITVANFGPTAAPGTLLTDPVVPGLTCTSVTCTSTAANMCPSPTPSIATLQGAGLAIGPSFPPNQSATLVVTCEVRATGV